MERSERIQVLLSCRDLLNEMSWDDQNLVLEIFGIGSQPDDPRGESPSLTTWLQQRASDTDLVALGQHLGLLGSEAGTTISEPDAEPQPLFVFASHLASQRKFLGEVEAELQHYSVRMFVAHDSIPMDADWNKEIVDALNGCHAGAVFLHDGFHGSYYCQQECGWILGRGIPVARLMMGESPRALLGSLQGKQLMGRSARDVCEAILDWAMEKQPLSGHLASSLSTALGNSPAYRYTDRIWDRLSEVDRLMSEQLGRVIGAAEANSQVFGARRGGHRYRQVIADRATVWDVQGLFAERISELRKSNTYIRPILADAAELRR